MANLPPLHITCPITTSLLFKKRNILHPIHVISCGVLYKRRCWFPASSLLLCCAAALSVVLNQRSRSSSHWYETIILSAAWLGGAARTSAQLGPSESANQARVSAGGKLHALFALWAATRVTASCTDGEEFSGRRGARHERTQNLLTLTLLCFLMF